jgi:hypothetical protein
MQSEGSGFDVRSTATLHASADAHAAQINGGDSRPYGLCTPLRRYLATAGALSGFVLACMLFASSPAQALKTHAFSASFGLPAVDGGPMALQAANEEVAGSGVAVNSATHDIYVADTGNDRADVFNAKGEFVLMFGKDVNKTKVLGGLATEAEDNVCSAVEVALGGECQKGVSGPEPGEFQTPVFVAVDDSPGGKGDVYIGDTGGNLVTKLTAEGKLEEGWGIKGQLNGSTATGPIAGPFSELAGVAVDSAGNLDVLQKPEHALFEFTQAGAFMTDFGTPRGSTPRGLVVNAEGDFFKLNGEPSVEQISSSGGDIGQVSKSIAATGLAVDPADSDLYVDEGGEVEHYVFAGPQTVSEPGGGTCAVEPHQGCGATDVFGAGHLGEGAGVAADAGTVYVASAATSEVVAFVEAVLPDLTTGEATGLTTEGSAVLNGTVNPDSEDITACKFEYVAAGEYEPAKPNPYAKGNTASCAQSVGSGSVPVPVSAHIEGLTPTVTYHYRLVAANNNGENAGSDRIFTALQRPSVEGEASSHVTATTAIVAAQVNPGGTSTNYAVEYGTTASYGSLSALASAGAGVEQASVQIHLAGLQPSTTYHVRVVAENELGSVHGDDLAFTTAASAGPSSSALPDGRAYERVSPSDTADGEVYVPQSGHQLESSDQTGSGIPFRASADGNAVAYVAAPPASGGNGSVGEGLGNDFMATRADRGWATVDLMPPTQEHNVYQGFSSDLSQSFLSHFEEPQLAPSAPKACVDLYSRFTGDGSYHPLFTASLTPGCGNPTFSGVSADNASVIFESEAALTPEAIPGNSELFNRTQNLYDSVGAHAYLVNILPNGQPEVNAAFGGASEPGEEGGPLFKEGRPGYHHYNQAISADGSRIVWTDLNTGNLYVREDPAKSTALTVLVAEGAYFRGASEDGSHVFYTKGGDLFEYEVDAGATTDLTPSGSVLGVLGNSGDGSYVYFVAEAVLASNANSHGEQATQGSPNLYVHAAGETKFIGTLSPEDNAMSGPSPNNSENYWGDWRSSFKTRTAEVAADERHLVFMSRDSLTGYDNTGGCRSAEGGNVVGCPEVFVYDAGLGSLSCASCNPTGEPPVAGGAFLPTVGQDTMGTYQPRWISDDGSRVFFDTAEPLVPQDTNGVQDVYEWERGGAGSCRRETACIYLLSGSLSNEEAFFVDASESGSDVFFTSRAQLVPEDQNELIDVYDARVNGGFTKVSTECTGTGCQGVPPAPAIFATPPSVTFNGIGNYPSSSAVKGKTTAQIRSERLAKALKACHKRHGKRKRHACERAAHRKYAGKSTAKRAKRANNSRRTGA